MSSSASSRKGSSKGSSRKHTCHSKGKEQPKLETWSEWSEWEHDPRGFWYSTRQAADGRLEYDYRQDTEVASSQGNVDTRYTNSYSIKGTPNPQQGNISNGESLGYTPAIGYGISYGGNTSSTSSYASSMATLTSNFSSMSSISSTPSAPSTTSVGVAEVRVVAWTLNTPNSPKPAKQSKPSKPKKSSSSSGNAQTPSEASFNESVVNDSDTRRKVDARDLGLRGNRTAICQLIIAYETDSGQAKSIGATGFLIDANTIVTAGHAVYHLSDHDDPSDSAHHAKSIKVFLGHDGRTTPSSCLVRHGHYVAVGRDYHDSTNNSGNDIACITLNMPFASGQAAPLRLKTTPTKSGEDVTMRIAGYPGDLNPNASEGMKLMYESEVSGAVSFDSQKRFHYRIDTSKGESGSPILVSTGSNYNDELVIGVHTSGDANRTQLNHGVDIHKEGNAMPAFLKALRSQGGAQEPDTVRVPIQSSSWTARDLSSITIKNYTW